MARSTKKAPAPRSQPSPLIKNNGKHKEVKQSVPIVVKPPPPVEISKEDEDEKDEDDEAVDDSEEGSSGDENGEGDSEDGGVDQVGMERLMELLGEDGLDDFDRAQLESFAEDDEDEEDLEDGAEDEKEEELSDREEEKDDTEEEEVESDNDVPFDEAESIDQDAVPKQKLEIDNQVALDRIRQTIQLDPSLPWTETLTIAYSDKIQVDVNDDLNRELAFYKQALHGAQTAHTLAAKHNFPFTRPSDYFAEMVKSDAHMERIRSRLLDENASLKRSEDKRKEREGKKFGKQVQIEKLKEREKAKKEIDDRLKGLKRKRKDMLDNNRGNDDDFDVAVEDAISDRPSKRSRPSEGANNKPRMTRHVRDKKYGFGGVGRRSKQNTKDSTDNFGPGAGRGKKGKSGSKAAGGKKSGKKPQRPGKSRRMTARNK